MALGKASANPDDQWNEYGTTFTRGEDVRSVSLYLYNVDSDATVWFDAVTVERAGPQ